MLRQFKSGKYRYSVLSQTLKNDEGEEYTAYGIKVLSGEEDIAVISDISVNYEEIRLLCSSCTENGLDPIHIYDVIEDFLP